MPHDLVLWFAAYPPGRSVWWESSGWNEFSGDHRGDPLVQVLGGIVAQLRRGADPDLMAGGTEIADAANVGQEWLDNDIEPDDACRWLALGCWDAYAIRAVMNHGGTPELFFAADGTWVLYGDDRLAEAPLIRHVLDGEVCAEDAVAIASGSAS